MVATSVPTTSASKPRSYHPDDFLPLLTVVQRHASVVFRTLPEVEREEAIAEAVAAAYVAYRRLRDRGIDPAREFPSMMATFAVRQVRDGRRVGGRRSSKDVLSPRAQRRHGFRVQSLPMSTRRSHEEVHTTIHGQGRMDCFEEMLHEDRKTPVPEQAAFRIDWPEFMRSLSQRDRWLATFLSLGNSAKEAAEKFRLSQGRVTQLRQGWCREWRARQGEEPVTATHTNGTASRPDQQPQSIAS
jgi:hypothetical protein